VPAGVPDVTRSGGQICAHAALHALEPGLSFLFVYRVIPLLAASTVPSLVPLVSCRGPVGDAAFGAGVP